MTIADDFRRRFGFTAHDDRAKADEYMQALSRRHDPEARLATQIADALVPSDGKRRPDTDGMIRLAIPSFSNDPRPLPKDPSLRRMQIARAVLESTDRHLSQGSDQGLPPELGAAARTETIRRLHVSDIRRDGLDRALERKSEERGRTVAAYLSNGVDIERHMDKLLVDIPRRGETKDTAHRLHAVREFHTARQPDSGPELKNWVRSGLRTERAMARAGLIKPVDVVRIAEATMKEADIDRLSTLPRARPDYEKSAFLSPGERRQEYSAAVKDMDAHRLGSTAAREAPRPEQSRGMSIQAGLAQMSQLQR